MRCGDAFLGMRFAYWNISALGLVTLSVAIPSNGFELFTFVCCTKFQFASSAGTLTLVWLYSLQVAAIITLIVIVIEFAWLLFTPTLTHANAHAHNDENKTALITRAIVIENHNRIRYCNGKSSECERTIRPTTTKTTHATLTTFAKGLKRLATQ